MAQLFDVSEAFRSKITDDTSIKLISLPRKIDIPEYTCKFDLILSLAKVCMQKLN
jgi:hypothetical protein